VASTFEFDASFFETELLPRFLGLRFDNTENELTFLIEREEKLALISAAILVDIHKVDPGQTTLRWDQLPIAVPGSQSIQHSKIVVLAWERLVRLIVGSANLTRNGYRKNREVFASLDFYNSPESTPRRPAQDAITLLNNTLQWSRVPPQTQRRTRETLSLVEDKLASWQDIPEDFRPREKPKAIFVSTHPAFEQKSESTIDQVAERWGSHRASKITIITPFVGKPDGEEDRVVSRLGMIPQTRDCVGLLVTQRCPCEETDPLVRVALHHNFGKSWIKCFESRGGAKVLAIPLCVKGNDKSNRKLHSKLFSLEGEDSRLLLIGSSNFTPHGMGIGVL